MKQTSSIIIIILLFCFYACKKATPASSVITTTGTTTTSTATTTLPAGPFTLQVTAGVGTGSYKTGDTAYIFSNPPSSTQVFDRWTGDIANLESPNEWRTILKMPAANVNVTATYRTTPNITFTNVVINGSQVYYYIPAAYRGIILPFHGSGGQASNWSDGQLENLAFCNYAAANGYAIVITESKDRVNGQWSISATNNVDVANIDVILQTLQTSGKIAAGTPLYGVGMSDGSAFCSVASYLRNYKAAALYCLGGVNSVYSYTTIPTIWNMASKDVTDDPNREISALANYNLLLSRNIPCVYYSNPPTPLYPSRFSIIPSINADASAIIYNDLKSAGYINTNGFFTLDPGVSAAWQSAIPSSYNYIYVAAIGDQLTVAYAQHKFYKDSNYRTIAFFNAH